MKKTILLLVLLPMVIFSQNENAKTDFKFGVEIDALPYLMNGYYFSSWSGKDNIRLRSVFSKFNSPKFITPDGFKDLETEVYAALVDYFPTSESGKFEKWWFAGGFEYWKNSVVNSLNNEKGKYNNLVFSVGGGYVWKIWRELYVNPWFAGHLLLTGKDNRSIGDNNFEPQVFLYEASIKFGWTF